MVLHGAGRESHGAHGYSKDHRPDPKQMVLAVVIDGEMRRRAAIEPVISHLKAEHCMDRNYLKGRDGDRANAILAASGYNFELLLSWFEAHLRALFQALLKTRCSAQYA